MAVKKPPSETKSIKRKGLLGILYFLGNSSYSALLGLAANLVFTVFLSPAEYGLYFIVLSLITMFNYFTDLGMAAALIQKKEPKEEEFYTAFTIQLILVTTIVLFGLALTPIIKSVYGFDQAGISLYLTMLISLFVLSLKSVPSTRLERKLDYAKIVLTQVVENTLFYVISIILMLSGYKIYALVVAIIVRSVVGTLLIYWFTKWKPKLLFSKKHAKSILKFGIPFQANVLLAFVKDDLLNLFLAQRLGLSGIGYVGWAKKWAEAILLIVINNVNRVLFPIFSKFQDNKERLKHTVEKVVFFNSLVLMPALAGAYLVMPLMVQLIPKYQKWALAVPSFNFFLISSLLVSFISPFINVFNSLGKVKTSVKFMLLWIGLNWTVVPLMIVRYGSFGVSIAFAINSLSFVFVIFRLKQEVPFNFIKSIRIPVIATLIMLVVTKFIQQLTFSIPSQFVLTIIAGVISYAIPIYLMTKGAFIGEILETFLPHDDKTKLKTK